MSEIVDKALALMLRHAANEANDYGDVRGTDVLSGRLGRGDLARR